MRAVHRQRYRADAHRGGGGCAGPRPFRSEPRQPIRTLGSAHRRRSFRRAARDHVRSRLRPPHHRHLDGWSLHRGRRGRRAPVVALGGERCCVNGPRLSALVVAHDEERQLAECLACLAFADEIVVVLDRCRDGSREIALGFTERLVEGAWEREGPRRHAGIDACRGPWILEIDADERVTSELSREIRKFVDTSTAAWHLIPVDNYIGTRRVRWGWGASFGRSAHAALFRKGTKEWGGQRVHPAVRLLGVEGARLSAPIVHLVDRDISAMLRRLDRYSSLRAQDLREARDIGSYGRN